MMTIEEMRKKRERRENPVEQALWEVAMLLRRQLPTGSYEPIRVCPECGKSNSKIIDGRGEARRRECLECGNTFDTEVIILESTDFRRPTTYEVGQASRIRSARSRNDTPNVRV